MSFIIIKKSWDYDALPWGIMLIVGIFGFLFFGLWGLTIGIFIIGAIINLAISLIFKILARIFDIGLISRKDRRLIAEGFVREFHNELGKLKRDHVAAMYMARKIGIISNLSKEQEEDFVNELEEMYSYEKTINAYSRYINEIFLEVRKIKNPVKRHRWDLGFSGLRENFLRGGQKWIEKSPFKSRPPFPSGSQKIKEIKENFVKFCDYVIFENSGIVSISKKY